MNQASKQFLKEFHDLCQKHGVDFASDLFGVQFLGDQVDVLNVENLADVAKQLGEEA